MSSQVKETRQIDKGVVLSSAFLDMNQQMVTNMLNYFMLYPDLFLDIITPQDSNFRLFFYQRIALRANMRYRMVSMTATRAASKSFIAILSQILKCIFIPGVKLFVCADVKATAIKVTKQKIDEIFHHWPLLQNQLQYLHMGNDYVNLKFKNGSLFDIVSMSSSGRGTRSNGGVVEESATIDGVLLNEVVIPMMNVSRRRFDGTIDPDQPNQAQCYITSAGSKTCFMYSKMIEMIVDEILRPQQVFVWGLSYKVPVMHGLIDQRTIDDQRFSPNFSTAGFARESGSIWTGSNNDSWFDGDQLVRRRTMMKCQRKYSISSLTPQDFYILSYDVGRFRANSAVTVIRVCPKGDKVLKKAVFLKVVHGQSLIDQATQIKKLIQIYHPRQVVIDGNGVGAGLVDAMIRPSFDNKTGIFYPEYYVFNDQNYLPPGYRTPPNKSIENQRIIIYCLKANSSNDSDIHANCYAQVANGQLSFLAQQRVIKQKLLATEKGQRMSLYDRTSYLMPYEMTSRLIDEMCNLRLKPTGVANQIKIEQISRSTHKDRFSSLEYGLWRVKAFQDSYLASRATNRDFKNATHFVSKRQTSSRHRTRNNRRR